MVWAENGFDKYIKVIDVEEVRHIFNLEPTSNRWDINFFCLQLILHLQKLGWKQILETSTDVTKKDIITALSTEYAMEMWIEPVDSQQ